MGDNDDDDDDDIDDDDDDGDNVDDDDNDEVEHEKPWTMVYGQTKIDKTMDIPEGSGKFRTQK